MNDLSEALSISPFALLVLEVLSVLIVGVVLLIMMVFLFKKLGKIMEEVRDNGDLLMKKIDNQGNMKEALDKNTHAIEKLEDTLTELCTNIRLNARDASNAYKSISDSMNRIEGSVNKKK